MVSSLKVPVIQAPMAGGINSTNFVQAAIRAGIVGSLGFGYSTADDVRHNLTALKGIGPVNANFFIFQSVADPPNAAAVDAAMKSLLAVPFAAQCTVSRPSAPYYPDLQSSLEAAWHLRPALLTFHFGIPQKEQIHQSKAVNSMVGVTVTSVAEAVLAAEEGVDFVIAQGSEAGGHRGSFLSSSDGDGEERPLTTLELVQRIVNEVGRSVPIVAAGGIMNGKDIHTMIQAGATAVQMGTAFLPCHESAASPAHKRLVLSEHERGTVMTSAFSGRPARSAANQFTHLMHSQQSSLALLPFPLQNTLTSGMRKRATAMDDGEYQSMYVGSNYRLARALSTEDLVTVLATELREATMYQYQ